MNILVTGGSGRLGSLLCERLVAKHKVKVFDCREPKLSNVEYFSGDLCNLEEVKKGIQDSDVVIHLAAITEPLPDNDLAIQKVNIEGTNKLLQAAVNLNIKKMIFASSICVYGFVYWKNRVIPDYFPIDEEHTCNPQDSYGTSKFACERIAYSYHARFGIQFASLRLACIWFPAVDGYNETYERRLNDPGCEESTRRIWSYVHVQDVVQAFELALNNEVVTFEVFNITGPDALSNEHSLNLIRDYYPEVSMIKNDSDFIANPYASLIDSTKAKKILGYKPAHSWRSKFSI